MDQITSTSFHVINVPSDEKWKVHLQNGKRILLGKLAVQD